MSRQSVSSLRQSFKSHDKFFLPLALFFVAIELSNVVTFVRPSFLSFVAIFISMSRKNSGASLGALLMQCHDRVIKCRDNTSAFRLPLCCDIHFCVATFFLYFFSYCVCDTPDPPPMCDVGQGCHCSFYLYTNKHVS